MARVKIEILLFRVNSMNISKFKWLTGVAHTMESKEPPCYEVQKYGVYLGHGKERIDVDMVYEKGSQYNEMSEQVINIHSNFVRACF
jgi:hypothetical protein